MEVKVIYFAELDYPEVQGVFDEKGNLIDSWSRDDANFREEYLSGFMEKLGIKIGRPSESFKKKLQKQLQIEYKEFLE